MIRLSSSVGEAFHPLTPPISMLTGNIFSIREGGEFRSRPTLNMGGRGGEHERFSTTRTCEHALGHWQYFFHAPTSGNACSFKNITDQCAVEEKPTYIPNAAHAFSGLFSFFELTSLGARIYGETCKTCSTCAKLVVKLAEKRVKLVALIIFTKVYITFS